MTLFDGLINGFNYALITGLLGNGMVSEEVAILHF